MISFCVLQPTDIYANAQTDNWGAYSSAIEPKGYEGHNFRFSAMVKTELADDSAGAQLWLRVDKDKGTGFFENRAEKPIRSGAWKPYVIQGKIDTGAVRVAFGLYCIYNGMFYFDDIGLEIETAKNKWRTVYTNTFEDGTIDSLVPGIKLKEYGINKAYRTSIVQAGSNGKALQVFGEDVPNFGINSDRPGGVTITLIFRKSWKPNSGDYLYV